MIRPFHLCCLMLGVIASEKILTFDPSAKTLRITCPAEGSVEGDLLSVHVYQKAGAERWDNLAVWQYGKLAEALSNRVEVNSDPNENPSGRLDVTLKGVTCFDAVTYKCSIVAETREEGTITNKNQEEFTFPLSLSQEPRKERYSPGELVALQCEATAVDIGKRLVWETGFHDGEEFSPITRGMENTTENSTGCAHSTLALSYTLARKDDGRIFRCRLQGSTKTKQVKVSVDCGEKDTSPTPTPTPTEDHTRKTTAVRDVDTMVAGKLQDEPSSVAGKDAFNFTTTVIVVTAVSLALLIVSSAFFVRQWRRKHKPQPLVVVDSPASSDSGYGYRGRHLPDLPTLGRDFPQKDDHTAPKWLSPSFSPSPADLADPQSPNSSVYVSMTGLDQLTTQKATPNAYEEGERKAQEAELEPEMRPDRSESMYSNSDAIDHSAKKARSESMAVGTSAHVLQATLLA